jgi:3-oxoacyl-[acyl-carrier protein] reductase
MTISRRQFTLRSLALLAASFRDAHSERLQARVLFVDGINNHDWLAATHAITQILTATGLFSVDVSTTPPRGATIAAWNSWRPDFSGYDVVINNFNGGHAAIFQADLRDELEVARLVTDVSRAFGPVDILVVNAGPQPFYSIEEQTWENYLRQLEFFVKSPLLLLKQVLPAMKKQRFGRIIQVRSEVFELGNPRFANYVAAKGAQLGPTRSWARKPAPDGITVNLVAPGRIPTERHADVSIDEGEAYRQQVPMKKMGDAADVAKIVAFLASDSARFITGQKFSVNGGNTLA